MKTFKTKLYWTVSGKLQKLFSDSKNKRYYEIGVIREWEGSLGN